MANIKRVVRLDFTGQNIPGWAIAFMLLVFPAAIYSFLRLTFGITLSDVSGYPFAVLFLSSSFSVFVQQPYNGLQRLYGALPLSKQEFVRGRYLFLASYLLAGWLLGVGYTFLNSKMQYYTGVPDPLRYIADAPIAVCLFAAHISNNFLRYGKAITHIGDLLLLLIKSVGMALLVSRLFSYLYTNLHLPSAMLLLLGLATGIAILYLSCEKACHHLGKGAI